MQICILEYARPILRPLIVRFFHDGTQLRTSNIVSTLSQLRVLLRCFQTGLSDEHVTDERETDGKDAQLGRCASPGVGECNSCGLHPATILLAYDSFDAPDGVEGRCSEVMDNSGDVALHGSLEMPFDTPRPPQRGQGVVAGDTYRNEETVEKTTVRVVGFEACAGSLEEVGGTHSIPGDSNFSAGRSTPRQCSKCKVVLHGLRRVSRCQGEVRLVSSQPFTLVVALVPGTTTASCGITGRRSRCSHGPTVLSC